jgi:hypothetical protein
MIPAQEFKIDDYHYCIDEFGAIHQLNPRPFVYDLSYVSTYDTPTYQRNSEILQALRLGFVFGVHGIPPQSLVDVGYGNGDFLKMAARSIPRVYGSDVTGVKIMDIETGDEYPEADVYTFWDCLEHIPDLDFLNELPARTIVISLPYCHFHTNGQEWFTNWKHRKPNEHLHHFDLPSLIRFMNRRGWYTVASSLHEDIIRISAADEQNILAAAFTRAL